MDMLQIILSCLYMVLAILCQKTVASDKGYGEWGQWGKWSDCDAKCGGGMMKKVREWIPGPKYVAPANGRTYTSSKILSCINRAIPNCPVDGEWSGWTSWSKCTKPCGQGVKTRKRICGGQKYNGKPCEGDSTMEAPCKRDPCPVLPRNFRMSQCTDKNFTCASNKMCIGGGQKCDDTVQCHDGSDEIDCPEKSRWTGDVKYDLSRGGGASTISQTRLLQLLTLAVVIVSLVTNFPDLRVPV